MKKNFLQDVIPASQKRSIRDIPLPNHKNNSPSSSKKVIYTQQEEKFNKPENSVFESSDFHTATFTKDIEEESSHEEHLSEKKYMPPYNHNKQPNTFMKKIVVGISIGVVIFIGFFLSRTEATITIIPKKTTQEVSNAIPVDGSSSLVTQTQITKSLSQTLLATAEQQVEKQATGKIKIINKHKETPQELIKNTRFQTPNGLIYRIRESIIIPGYTMSGSTLVPGTLEVEVFADSAGEEYNVKDVNFTIPGFDGREQFEKITAQSIGEIAGGYIGIRKVVSEEAKETALEKLKADLKVQIEQTQKESTEYIIVPDITTLTYGELQDQVDGDSVILSLSARVNAYSLVKKELFNFVGQNSIMGATANDNFTLESDKLTFSVNEGMIEIKGSTLITWVTDNQKLKNDFMGKKRSEASTIIDSYNSFEKGTPALSPFWKTRFPSDASKISVVIAE